MSGEPQKEQLTPEKLDEITKETVWEVHDLLPGRSHEEKKEWCTKRLAQVLEMFDNYIPVIGLFIDNPVVDDFEQQGVRLLVDWAWDKLVETDKDESPSSKIEEL